MKVEYLDSTPGRPLIKVEGKTNPGLLFFERDLAYEKIMLEFLQNELNSQNPSSPASIWIQSQLSMIQRYFSTLTQTTYE